MKGEIYMKATVSEKLNFENGDAGLKKWRGGGDSNSRGETPPVFKTGAVGQA